MLFSLPDNDAWSHRNGPHAQVTSIAAADRQLERLMHAGGGPEQFLEDHAVVVTSDHSQALVEERIRLDLALADFHVATPSASRVGRRRAGAQPGAALGDDLRARPRAPRGADRARRWRRSTGSRASISRCGCAIRDGGAPEAVIRAPGGARAAVRARRRARSTRAASAGASRATSSVLRGPDRGRALREPRLSRRARAGLVGAAL